MLFKALQFAGEKHRGQFRRESGLPYVVHPTSVAFLLAKYKRSKRQEELQVACLLHDTLEDTDTSFTELAEEFSPLVASLVLALTSDKEEIEAIGKTAYLTKKMLGMSNYALAIKLADRLSNILDNPSESYKEQTASILEVLKTQRQLTKSHLRLIEAIQEEL